MNLLDRITINPLVCNGKPTIRDSRVTVQTILEFLAEGDTEEEILQNYPFLEKEDILAALQYASELLKQNYSLKQISQDYA